MFSSHFTSCASIIVSSSIDDTGKAWETWNHLERLVKAYKPEIELVRKDFAEGQLVESLIHIMKTFLNITLSDAEIMRERHEGFVDTIPDYPENE